MFPNMTLEFCILIGDGVAFYSVSVVFKLARSLSLDDLTFAGGLGCGDFEKKTLKYLSFPLIIHLSNQENL